MKDTATDTRVSALSPSITPNRVPACRRCVYASCNGSPEQTASMPQLQIVLLHARVLLVHLVKKRKKIVLRVKHARVLLVHHRKQTAGIDALSPSITPNRSIAVLTARRRQSSARLANQTCLGSKHSRVLLVKLHAARFFVTLHRRASVHKQWCSVLGDQSIPYHSRTASPLDSHRPDFAKQTSTKLRIH